MEKEQKSNIYKPKIDNLQDIKLFADRSAGINIEEIARKDWNIEDAWNGDVLKIPYKTNIKDLVIILGALGKKFPNVNFESKFQKINDSLQQIEIFLIWLLPSLKSIISDRRDSSEMMDGTLELINSIRYYTRSNKYVYLNQEQLIAQVPNLLHEDCWIQGAEILLGKKIVTSRQIRAGRNLDNLKNRLAFTVQSLIESISNKPADYQVESIGPKNQIFLQISNSINQLSQAVLDDYVTFLFGIGKDNMLNKLHWNSNKENIKNKVPENLQAKFLSHLDLESKSISEQLNLDNKRLELENKRIEGSREEVAEMEKRFLLEIQQYISLIPWNEVASQTQTWVEKRSFVCFGFAMTTMYALEYLKIPCALLLPTNHAQNLVVIGNNLYWIEPQLFVTNLDQNPILESNDLLRLETPNSSDSKNEGASSQEIINWIKSKVPGEPSIQFNLSMRLKKLSQLVNDGPITVYHQGATNTPTLKQFALNENPKLPLINYNLGVDESKHNFKQYIIAMEPNKLLQYAVACLAAKEISVPNRLILYQELLQNVSYSDSLKLKIINNARIEFPLEVDFKIKLSKLALRSKDISLIDQAIVCLKEKTSEISKTQYLEKQSQYLDLLIKKGDLEPKSVVSNTIIDLINEILCLDSKLNPSKYIDVIINLNVQNVEFNKISKERISKKPLGSTDGNKYFELLLFNQDFEGAENYINTSKAKDINTAKIALLVASQKFEQALLLLENYQNKVSSKIGKALVIAEKYKLIHKIGGSAKSTEFYNSLDAHIKSPGSALFNFFTKSKESGWVPEFETKTYFNLDFFG